MDVIELIMIVLDPYTALVIAMCLPRATGNWQLTGRIKN